MDLALILRIINILLLAIIAALLYINRKAENQRLPRLAFIILLAMFILQFAFFK
jgi:heme A synthase